MKNGQVKFAGFGTVMMSSIARLANLEKQENPLEIVESLKRHRERIYAAIEARAGIPYQYVGGSVFAFWHPQHASPNHAQLAFDAARDILALLPSLMEEQLPLTYDVEISLGTGDMLADVFGPSQQFQIIGSAVIIADRIVKAGGTSGSAVRMSQYTADLLQKREELAETDKLGRDNLDDLRIYSFPPPQSVRQ
ncbi:hypothetical protein BH11PSE11_BH11PSE11_10460 [soil metagenome]